MNYDNLEGMYHCNAYKFTSHKNASKEKLSSMPFTKIPYTTKHILRPIYEHVEHPNKGDS